jgi:pimeloyl-ACP methyl ester carboxylesterase
VLKFPASKAQMERFAQTLAGLRGSHVIEGAGHWIQRERAERVSELLVSFLRRL